MIRGCKYGKKLKADGKVIVRSARRGSIKLGNNITINARIKSNLVGLIGYSVLQCLEGGIIEIQDGSGLSSVVISSRKKITIGKNVMLGGNVKVLDHDFHSLDYLKRREVKKDFENVKSEEVIIGDDVFIGTDSIVLKGVNIGNRSIIGAGSVLSLKNIPEDSLVAGNPAVIISLKKI